MQVLNVCCAVDGEWSDWGQWSECSAECGGGIQRRHRTCQHPQFGGDGCHGDASQVKKCNIVPCEGFTFTFGFTLLIIFIIVYAAVYWHYQSSMSDKCYLKTFIGYFTLNISIYV